MSASAEMPYFIKPSINLDKAAKQQAYQEAIVAINANLEGATSPILKMATINCILKTFLPYYYWVCLLYTSPSPRDGLLSRMPSSA